MAELKNIRIAISGIYDYAFEELPSLRVPLPGAGAPEWVEKKRIYKVYRPASVLSAACDKFKMLPLTHHHPRTPVDGQNFRDLTIGYTGENPWIDYLDGKDEVGIRSTAILYDDEAMDAYERGEVQLSPGYIADFTWQRGTDPHGNQYDIVMQAITDVNHLALLPAGRGGEDAVVMDQAPAHLTIFDIVRKTHENVCKDGAPYGNDNASKGHVKKEDEGLDDSEKKHLRSLLQSKAVDFPVVEFTKENFNKYLGTPIDTPMGKVKLGSNQFEKLEKKNRKDLIGAVRETLANPCFIGEAKEGPLLFVKSFKKSGDTKNIMSVVIQRDGLNISISTHEEREEQILNKIKKAGVLRETSGDDGTVHDNHVADTARAVYLTITDEEETRKSIFDLVRDQENKTVFDLFK